MTTPLIISPEAKEAAREELVTSRARDVWDDSYSGEPYEIGHHVQLAINAAVEKVTKELQKWKEEDPRMLREQIRVADVAFNHALEQIASLTKDKERLKWAIDYPDKFQAVVWETFHVEESEDEEVFAAIDSAMQQEREGK